MESVIHTIWHMSKTADGGVFVVYNVKATVSGRHTIRMVWMRMQHDINMVLLRMQPLAKGH